MNTVSITIFITVFIAIIIGIMAGKNIKNRKENFYIAGRKWPWIFVAMALVGQAIDGNSTLGSTSLGFDFGFWAAAAFPIGLALSLFLLGKFFAPKLNSLNLMTLADFFHIKYNRRIEVIASLLMLFSFGILLAGNIAAVAILLMNYVSINYQAIVILVCIIILLYIIRGGIISDLYSDFWQLAVLTLGTVAAFVFTINKFDFTGFFTSQAYINGSSINQMFSLANGGLINWATVVALGFGNILAIDFNSRIYAARTPQDAEKGCYWGALFTLIFGIPFALLPLMINFLNIQPIDGSPILLVFAHSILPPFIIGLLISGIIAAAFTTIDGAILSMGNIITQNLLRVQDDIDDPSSVESEKTFLYFSRLSLIPITCLAMIFAILMPSPGVLLTVSFDIMFSSLLAPFVFAFYLKKPNITAAIYSIVAGSVTRLLFAILTPTSFGITNSILYIPNSLINPNWDGLGTIIAPLVSFIVYLVIYLYSKNNLAKNMSNNLEIEYAK